VVYTSGVELLLTSRIGVLGMGDFGDGSKAIPNYTTGWWFGTFSIFPYIGNNNPN